MKILDNGNLANLEVFGPSCLGNACFPDGIVFDSYGNLWGTLIIAEKVFLITPDGEYKIILDDGNKKAIDIAHNAFLKGQLTPEIIENSAGKIAPLMTSITFGGPDFKTVYIGSLLGKRIPFFKSPVTGLTQKTFFKYS